jgi:hypothetical protein
MLADELAANASFTLAHRLWSVYASPIRWVEVEVTDDDQRLPLAPPLDTERLDGRGLLLVSTLAQAWGVRLRPKGKTVWFRIAAPTTA